jgi:hypothetical protein
MNRALQPPFAKSISRDPSTTAFAANPKVSRFVTGVYVVLSPLYLGLAGLDFVRHRHVAIMDLALGLMWATCAVLRIAAPRWLASRTNMNRRAIQPPFLGAFKSDSAIEEK